MMENANAPPGSFTELEDGSPAEPETAPPRDPDPAWEEWTGWHDSCRWDDERQDFAQHADDCPHPVFVPAEWAFVNEAREHAAGKPAPPKRSHRPNRGRKLRPEDIGGLLVEVGKGATQDPRLTDVDRDVYYAMLGRAHGLTETEITAPRRWLNSVTGHPEWKCRDALGRLERFGYLQRIARDEVKRQKLLNWLASHTFEHGRLPGIYRMSLNPPRWDDVPDFAAPLDPDWRDRVDALLAG